MSNTPTKKAIVDFLWEWASSQGDWSKLLVSRIVATETHLSSTDRAEIFNYFLQSLKLFSGLPAFTITKPVYTPTTVKIELESLSEITGVNKLARDQKMVFSKNITVVYGENGTGKTGYSRILRALGFGYDNKKNVLPNIYSTAEPQSAKINFTANGTSKTFVWDGKNNDVELQNISVFNNTCVQYSISDRSLIVTPIGFHLFQLVSEELDKLSQLLQTKIGLHPISIGWSSQLSAGTSQYNFISTLSDKSDEHELITLSEFTESHQKSLLKKLEELSHLNKAFIQAEIRSLSSFIQELDSLIGKIESAQQILTPETWQALIKCNKDIAELENTTQKGIEQIADERGIEFFKTQEFNSFLIAAEKYIKVINQPEYPNTDDTCIYCLQPLDQSAKELLNSYRILLNDRTQEKITVLKKQRGILIQLVSEIDANLTFHQLTFGTDAEQKPLQPSEIIEYNSQLVALKNSFTTGNVPFDSIFDFSYDQTLTFLKNKRDSLNDSLTNQKNILGNLASTESILLREIAELKDRKLLSEKIIDIKNVINNNKIVYLLNQNLNSFSTKSISRKTSSAREELVQQDFEEIFRKELIALRKANLKITLTFGTDKGNSKVFQSISQYALADILSEGEQKSIALAEFLTELQLDNTEAPIIFDDPVNSLDHRIIDEVVKRLIETSKNRQVIIFTHSILLLHSFIQQSELEHHKQAGLDFVFHKVKENFGKTGILDEVEEINSFSYYIKKLNAVLQTKHDGQEEAKLAAEGYGHLRSAIEVAVEDDIFKKTIKRYKKGVAFPSLMRINGAKIDQNKSKLNDIYEKCCVCINGHSSPEVIQTTPKIDELKTDFAEFKKIRDEFK